MSKDEVAGLKALHTLKKRLYKYNNQMEVQQENGSINLVTCTFQEPANIEEINEFLIKTGWVFPVEYQKFILLHNGANLFTHDYYGGGVSLLDLRMIKQFSIDYELPDSWYPIAWSHHSLGSICVNSEKVEEGLPYLLWLGPSSPIEEAVYLDYGFDTWLERLIICQGVEYWLWSCQK